MDTELDKVTERYRRSVILSFEGSQESAFDKWYTEQHKRHISTCVYIAIAMFVLSGSLDLILLDERVVDIWKIRYPIFLPMLLILGFAIYVKKVKHQQLILSLLVIIIGAAMIQIVDVTQGSISQIYFNGLLLTQMAGLTATRMRFSYAVYTTCCIAIMLSLYLLLDKNNQLRIIIADIYLLAGMTFFSLTNNYFLERSQRLDYLKQEVISQNQKKLVASNESLKTLVSVDGLTGVNNRRAFDNALSKEYRRATREGSSISLLMLDIDFFKHYNDSYGHQEGDHCLQRVASTLSQFPKREGDFIGRYGGEEFAIILPNTSAADAQEIAANTVRAIARLNIPHKTSSAAPYVTISAGAGTITPTSGTSASDLIRLADKCLYQAKALGRNQLVAEEQSTPLSANIDHD